MNTIKYPLAGGERKFSPPLYYPPPVFATFDPGSASDLMGAARSAVSTAELLLAFVHGNRGIARQAGIETITIEIFAVMQGESFTGVMDAIEEAGQKKQPLNLTHAGLSTLRRMEALIAEASMNIRKFTDGDLADMQPPEEPLGEKEKQEAVASMKSSLGSTPPVRIHLAQADQSKSSDLSFLIPFAIISAVAATVAVVLVATREK